jgi:rubrerythrin
MMNHNLPQQSSVNANQHHALDSAAYTFDRATQVALLAHHWSCTNCGTAHTHILPETCTNCGATALEFKYVASGEMAS